MDNIIHNHNKNVNIQILTYNIGNDLLMIHKFMFCMFIRDWYGNI